MASESSCENKCVGDTGSVPPVTLPPFNSLWTEEGGLSQLRHIKGSRNDGKGVKQITLPTDLLYQGPTQRQQDNLGKQSTFQEIPASLPTIAPPTQKVANRTQLTALASKSNYEHIVHASAQDVGLFYSDALMASVTAKRRQHKLSEKNRRDRMRIALEALSDAISEHASPRTDVGGAPPDFGGRRARSEVADGRTLKRSDRIYIVEAATLYIRQLKENLVEANRRLHEARRDGL